MVPARRGQNGRRPPLPAPCKKNQQSGDHFRTLARACVNSALNAANSRSTPPARPIRTWSAPARPCGPITARANARKRRFIRLRTTALPIFFVTVIPSLIAGFPSFRLRTKSTKPGVATRLAALAARKSDRFLIEIRRKASCDRGHGAHESPRVRRLSPSGRGNRGGVREPGCSAEKCASSLMSLAKHHKRKKGRPRRRPLLRAPLGKLAPEVNCLPFPFASFAPPAVGGCGGPGPNPPSARSLAVCV